MVFVPFLHDNRPGRAGTETGPASAASFGKYPGFTDGAGLPRKNDCGFRTVFRAGPAKNVIMGKASSSYRSFDAPGRQRLKRPEQLPGTALHAGPAKTAGPTGKIHHRAPGVIRNKDFIFTAVKAGAAVVALRPKDLVRQGPRWEQTMRRCRFIRTSPCQKTAAATFRRITVEKVLETLVGQKRSQIHSCPRQLGTILHVKKNRTLLRIFFCPTTTLRSGRIACYNHRIQEPCHCYYFKKIQNIIELFKDRAKPRYLEVTCRKFDVTEE